MKRSAPLLILLALVITTSGCAHMRTHLPTPEGDPKPPVFADPMRIVGGEDPLTGLDGYDADDLFRLGYEAFEVGDLARAVALYERLLDEFPEHRDCTPATWNLALGREKLGDIPGAIDAYAAYAVGVEEASPLEAGQARIRQATLLQHLGLFVESKSPLALAEPVEELEPHERWEIRILQAMALADEGDFDHAEIDLNRVRREIRRTTLREGELFPYQSAMVWFEAGQLYRMRSTAIGLEEVDDLAVLDAELGEKARLLLEARQHFKRSLTHRVAAWSGPAALALGAVYEDFRADLLSAPRPSELSDEAAEVYDDLLERQTRQFLEKAAVDYREVLRLGTILRLEAAWVEAVEDALHRCEEELGTGATAEVSSPKAVHPPGDG
jgi:tetratricopeptide (TPR) repeat protein